MPATQISYFLPARLATHEVLHAKLGLPKHSRKSLDMRVRSVLLATSVAVPVVAVPIAASIVTAVAIPVPTAIAVAIPVPIAIPITIPVPIAIPVLIARRRGAGHPVSASTTLRDAVRGRVVAIAYAVAQAEQCEGKAHPDERDHQRILDKGLTRPIPSGAQGASHSGAFDSGCENA
jgi:hypothetical protein